MKTQTHTRNVDYRNLYRAHIVRNVKDKSTQFAWELETKRLVNKAHKAFWEKRGFKKPPHTSKIIKGDFDLPIPEDVKREEQQ